MAYAPVPRPSSPLMAINLDHVSQSTQEAIPGAKDEAIPGSATPVDGNKLTLICAFAWKTLFLPIMGLLYLIFCYVCFYRLVKVSESVKPMKHLSIIKASVTTLSIIFVSVSLLPLSSLISELKSEEFFRVLSGRHQGSPLSTINTISTPSHGMRDSLVTLYRRQATKYYVGAFIAGLIFLAASALAPAALSVGTIPFDGDLMAFSVGAVLQDSVLSVSNLSRAVLVTDAARNQLRQSGSIAWAEVYLGFNYSFHLPIVDKSFYIVPQPIDLPTNTSARWLSDVAEIRPTCEWIAPQFLNMSPTVDETALYEGNFTMILPQKNVQVLLSGFDMRPVFSQSIMPLQGSWADGPLGEISNGASAWIMMKCLAGCDFPLMSRVEVAFGSGQPTSRYDSTDGYSVEISFLYCEPNTKIQTRHVHNNGQASLTLGETVPQAQGNLHPGQTNLLFTYTFNDFDKAGPATQNNITEVGNEAGFFLIFGEDVGLNATRISPQAVETITERYGQFLQSATKKFMDGSLESVYVPGRTTREIAVFISSLPHIIVSTVLYVVLSVFVVVCYFRRTARQFTLLTVAASLANSNILPVASRLRLEQGSGQEREIMLLGNAWVVLSEDNSDGLEVLQLRGDEALARDARDSSV